MAQVTLQVVVNDQALDALTKKVDALDHRRINIDATGIQKGMQGAADSTAELDSNLEKMVRVYDPNGKLIKGVDKLRIGTNQTAQVTAKLNKETGNLETTSTKVTTNLAKGQKDHTKEVEKGTEAVKQQGLFYKILGTNLSSFIARSAAYRTIAAGLHAITNGFKDALAAMKAVDDELVTVRKVTGFSDAQIEAIKDQAYSTASMYGVEAADYLSAVAAFSRAGYKDLAADLAELSLKTQIVGDTTQEVANQFLLSVDAAYKYKGSVEALTRVLDGANEIDNKYATSIEKIAEGMGIVAPVAAQMHVGVDELTAALGTITAVTQRSGSESARALRALYLNIVGDTKTEIEEGVTWTTGEIAGLQDVIKKYAKDAYLAAQATGDIIDPMKAIEGLSKSIKDGVLSEAELMEMVSDIGGKLRTSQLLALINNWDMYESMLKDYKNAYGSSNKEIDNAMDSWSRKAAVLKNTWTEFLQKTIDPKKIKDVLDFLSNAIKHTDSLTGVLVRIGTVIIALKLPKIASHIGSIITAVKSLEAGTASLNTTLSVTAGYIGTIIALAVAMYSVTDRMGKRIADDINQRQKAAAEAKKAEEEEAKQKIESSRQAISSNNERLESISQLREAYINLTSAKFTEEERDSMLVEWKNKVAEAYGVEKSALEKVNEERKTGLSLLDELEEREIRRAYAGGLAGYEESVKTVSGKRTYRTDEISEAVKDVLLSIYGLSGDGDWSDWGGEEGLFGAKNNGWVKVDITVDGGGNVFSGTQRNGVIWGRGFSQEASFSAFDGGKIENIPHDVLDFYGEYDEIIENINYAIDELAKRKAVNNGLTQDEIDALSVLSGVLTQVTDEHQQSSDTIEDFLPTLAKYNLIIRDGITKDTFKNAEEYAEKIREISAEVENGTLNAEVASAMIEILEQMFPKFAKQVGVATSAQNVFTDSVITGTEAIGSNEAALASNATASERAAAAKKDAEAAARKLIPVLFDEQNKLTAAGKAALSMDSNLASLVKSELDAQLAAKQANYSNLVAQIASVGGMAAYARAQLESMNKLTGNPLVDSALIIAETARLNWEKVKIQNDIDDILNQIKQVNTYVPTTTNGSPSDNNSSSSSSSSSTEDKKLKSLKERIDLLKSELSLLKAQGASEEDLAKKMKEIADAILAEKNYLKSINGDQITINNLETERLNILNDIDDLLKEEEVKEEKQEETEDKKLKAYEKRLDLLRTQVRLMKERGDSDDEIVKKLRTEQVVIRAIINHLKEIKADAKTILEYETQWWELENEISNITQEEEDTEDKKRKAYENRIDRLKSELSLMKERGDSEEDILAKEREIQKVITALVTHLKSIHADQVTINNLERDWWSIENEINNTAEKTREEKEATAKAIQDALDAQLALNNAMKERNVHVFNSETGRWEWQANPTTVQNARDALERAVQNIPEAARNDFIRDFGITLTGAGTSYSNVGGSNYYGNTYTFGNFTLTEDQARSTSVYELARLSSALGLYNHSV